MQNRRVDVTSAVRVDADGQHEGLVACVGRRLAARRHEVDALLGLGTPRRTLDALVALDLVLGLGGGGDVRRHLEIAGVFCLCSVFPPVTRELFCLRAGSGFSLRAD